MPFTHLVVWDTGYNPQLPFENEDIIFLPAFEQDDSLTQFRLKEINLLETVLHNLKDKNENLRWWIHGIDARVDALKQRARGLQSLDNHPLWDPHNVNGIEGSLNGLGCIRESMESVDADLSSLTFRVYQDLAFSDCLQDFQDPWHSGTDGFDSRLRKARDWIRRRHLTTCKIVRFQDQWVRRWHHDLLRSVEDGRQAEILRRRTFDERLRRRIEKYRRRLVRHERMGTSVGVKLTTADSTRHLSLRQVFDNRIKLTRGRESQRRQDFDDMIRDLTAKINGMLQPLPDADVAYIVAPRSERPQVVKLHRDLADFAGRVRHRTPIGPHPNLTPLREELKSLLTRVRRQTEVLYHREPVRPAMAHVRRLQHEWLHARSELDVFESSSLNGMLTFGNAAGVLVGGNDDNRNAGNDSDLYTYKISAKGHIAEMLDKLPTIQLTAENQNGIDGETICGICRGEKEIGDTVVKLGCGHWYDAECLERWLKQSMTCPECRGKVD